jgi:nitroreductase
MDVFEAIYKRVTTRKFKNQPIPEETLFKLLEAGTMAPNTFNKEQWEFIIINDPELRSTLVKMREKIPPQKTALETASIILAVAYNSELGIDATGTTFACIENILLAATALGIAGVTLSFRGEKIKELLNVNEPMELASVLCLGYPDETPVKPQRVPLKEKIHYNKL